VRQLEGAELIARRPNPNDGRAVLLSLTPKGRELHDQTHVFRRQTFEKLLSGLTPEERDIMLTLMEKALDLTESNYHPHSHVMEITT
jgi:DNA-binding MarR family transcriptional regulator